MDQSFLTVTFLKVYLFICQTGPVDPGGGRVSERAQSSVWYLLGWREARWGTQTSHRRLGLGLF
jgi:hypothetical protein